MSEGENERTIEGDNPEKFVAPQTGEKRVGEEMGSNVREQSQKDLERAQKLEEERAKYKNKWWDSDNALDVVWGQLNEDIILVDKGKLNESFEKVFGHPVSLLMWMDKGDMADIRQELREKYPDSNLDEINALSEE